MFSGADFSLDMMLLAFRFRFGNEGIFNQDKMAATTLSYFKLWD